VTDVYSLYELNHLIRSVFDTSFPETFLVTAEIASCDARKHCYLTLVEKDDDAIVAEIRAVIWASRYTTIASSFLRATGTELNKGIKILFEASLIFHERYGLKLDIVNIDPAYTIGELAVKRKEVLERLAKEGLREKNKVLAFPLVPQRIGIISSPAAAGYEDLMSHLAQNPYGYRFTCRLYEALMQGDRAEGSIISALKRCSDDASSLDVVVIVRGGGGKPDLHCFDSYEIGRAIAFLSIPVIAGIGHERDITVVDEVSHVQVKTPTAAADLIITRVKGFEDTLDEFAHRVVKGAQILLLESSEALSSLARIFEGSVRNEVTGKSHMLNIFVKGARYALKFLRLEHERIRSRENNINHLNPRNVLKRGYSITYGNGTSLMSVQDIKTGDIIRTVLFQGELMSRVEVKKKKRRQDAGRKKA
jgi:exodeoxyribonuclease VII large subunit